jgi:prepilin-type N-terminal cleavage/methylation domain-containing protein/prepilin-type processing-associated H-X9-DG protein
MAMHLEGADPATSSNDRFKSGIVRRSGESAGFTLVELLVVVGIVAVLVAMLLPMLNKAREAAKTAVCLSNMRQVYLEVRMYANQNRDMVLVGYNYADKRYSNLTWYGQGVAAPSYNGTSQPYQFGGWTGIGWMYHGGFMKNPKIYWDPDQLPTNNFLIKATTVVKSSPIWPPGNWGIASYPSLSNGVYWVGYYTRPSVGWGAFDPTIPQLPPCPGGVPRFTQLKSAAILTEGKFNQTNTDGLKITNYDVLPHRRGMNVLYADGSAQWVPGSAFMKNMLLAQPSLSAANTYMLSGTYPTATGVWGDFDKAH